MTEAKVGAIKFRSKTAAVTARLKAIAKSKNPKHSLSEIAEELGVTPALVSQIKKKLMADGLEIKYDINQHRGRPRKEKNEKKFVVVG